MAAVKFVLFLAALCITQWVPSVVAQFEQDYDIGQIQIVQDEPRLHYTYTPSPADIPIDVIDLYPQSVLLVYNCFYMTAICRNAYNFAHTERGMTPHPTSYVNNRRYGYDLNTGNRRTTRLSRRRSQSCPRNWKNRHVCPEFDQAPIFRHDGQWWTTDTRGSGSNYILDEPVNAMRRSKMQYSYDEFPPASWVKGGNSLTAKGNDFLFW